MSTKLTADLNAVQNAPIELEYLNGDLNIIQKLDDEPNDVGGLTSAQLKAKFDEAGNAIKDYINNVLIPAILAADATEAERTEAEAARASAESARAIAETARAQEEAQRSANEETRKSNESARGTAETDRATAEQDRATAESARATAETQRTQTETDRKNAETARAEAESKRKSAESSRASSETQRGTNETARQTAEQTRESAEQQRQTNEQARQEAENARNSWGDYSPSKSYAAGNKVASGGSSYVCIKPCKGVAPPDAAYWQLIAQRGNDGQGAPTVPSTTKPIKGDGSGGLAAAVPETDYASPVFMRKVTLPGASWNSNTKQQTVAVPGVFSDGTKQQVFCSPVDESYDSAWNTCYVQCVGHGADSLTFQCDDIPTAAVEVFVSIQPVNFAS